MLDFVDTRKRHLRHRDGRVRAFSGGIVEEGWSVVSPIDMKDGWPSRDADALDEERAWQEMREKQARAYLDVASTPSAPTRDQHEAQEQVLDEERAWQLMRVRQAEAWKGSV